MSWWVITIIAVGVAIVLSVLWYLSIWLALVIAYLCENKGGLKPSFRGRVTTRLKGTGMGIYDWLLWITGFRKDEDDEDTVSAMLKRQKERMGAWWWLMSLGTIALTLCILGFQIWLLFHIIFLEPATKLFGLFKKVIKRGGQK